ncbi:hypothetical protein [Roseicella aerolata]|uniref:Uncharacterized protein n=1 Tax=Roseicella aerolata TaxID=2883479 RepID=A0A9X1L6F1_9PROT|nr:hypothetical protein [Roseicella aerolata]MCB4820751.1 hypothetical protein [Roseicella aerolata]
MADMPDLAMLRLWRGAEHVHRLGPRALAELLAEIGAAHGCSAAILERLAAYRRLSPGMIRVAGADAFPPVLREVPR